MLTKQNVFNLFGNLVGKPRPFYVLFRISERCNLRCRQCSVWKLGNAKNELSLAQIDEIADKLKKLGVGIVNIGGGEPFMRTDLVDIVKIFSKKGFNLRIQSNGLFITEEKADDLIKAGLRHISISLDTLDAPLFDYICNGKKVWERVVRGICLMSEKLPKRNSMPNINAVVSKLNMKELPNLVKFTHEIGFYSTFVPVQLSDSQDHSYLLRDYAPDMKVKTEERKLVDTVYDKIIEMKKSSYRVFNTYNFLEESRTFMKTGKVTWDCKSPGRLFFVVKPNGMVAPCSELLGVYPILSDNFLNDFNAEKYQQLIDKEVERGCEGCMHPCWAETTEMFNSGKVFFERMQDGFNMIVRKRNSVSYEEAEKLANKIKNEKLL